jgi:hypothetical protein
MYMATVLKGLKGYSGCNSFGVHVKLFSVRRTLKKLITLAVPPLPYWRKVGWESPNCEDEGDTVTGTMRF